MRKNVELKYSSGNVLSEKIHKIGIIALGSHRENHGSALPIDTDSKIAANVALRVATDTGATFLGIFYGATEYDYVKHGHHLSKEELIDEIIKQLIYIKEILEISDVIIINGHGGNNLIIPDIPYVEEKTNLNIIFNNSIIENEGPHACDGELSMGKVLGILDESRIEEQSNFNINPEVGMVGLELARKNNEIIDEEARNIENSTLKVDADFGQKLLNHAYDNIIEDIKKLI